MKVFKLTDPDMKTHNGFRWKIGVPRKASGKGELCGPGWLHCYLDPVLGVLMNPNHANIQNPRLFEAEGEGKEKHDPLKSGFTRMTLVREIPLPDVTIVQKVRFAILCAKEVCADPKWVAWADRWLSGEDRSAAAAFAAAAVSAASAAAYAAAFAAATFTDASDASAAPAVSAASAFSAGKDINFVALAHRAVEEES
jgi:hypothetical protein